jgi:hypothetical protein
LDEPEEENVLLGTDDDEKIAAKVGITVNAVTLRRVAMEIKALFDHIKITSL